MQRLKKTDRGKSVFRIIMKGRAEANVRRLVDVQSKRVRIHHAGNLYQL